MLCASRLACRCSHRFSWAWPRNLTWQVISTDISMFGSKPPRRRDMWPTKETVLQSTGSWGSPPTSFLVASSQSVWWPGEAHTLLKHQTRWQGSLYPNSGGPCKWGSSLLPGLLCLWVRWIIDTFLPGSSHLLVLHDETKLFAVRPQGAPLTGHMGFCISWVCCPCDF